MTSICPPLELWKKEAVAECECPHSHTLKGPAVPSPLMHPYHHQPSSLSLTHTLFLSLTHTLLLSLTRTHSLSLLRSLSLVPSLSLCLPLSFSFTISYCFQAIASEQETKDSKLPGSNLMTF